MSHERPENIRDGLSRLIQLHVSTIALLEGSVQILQAQLESLGDADATDAPSGWAAELPVIDRGAMAVRYQGRSCELGDSLKLRFLERLLSRPNQYVSYRTLLEDVWRESRDDATIRSLVKTLRSKLRAAGMDDLASAIDGHVKHHYAVKLARLA